MDLERSDYRVCVDVALPLVVPRPWVVTKLVFLHSKIVLQLMEGNETIDDATPFLNDASYPSYLPVLYVGFSSLIFKVEIL